MLKFMKNSYYTRVILFCFIFISSFSFTQIVQTPVLEKKLTQEKCGTDRKHEILLQKDSDYAKKRREIEEHYQEYLSYPFHLKAVKTIPVVVHVIHLGESVGTGTNISDNQIISAINNLNDAFRNRTPYSTSSYPSVDTEIEFCLAQRDPSGNPTNGILRVNGTSLTGYSAGGIGAGGASETSVKALSKWDNTKYYNIWVVSEIDNNGGGAGTQGYAYFPGAGATVDGTVILYNAFGYDPTNTLGYNLKTYTNRNATTTHEIGHALNLYHTFQGDGGGGTCPSDSDCGTNGDCVTDTPRHRRSNSDCQTGTTNTCTSTSRDLHIHNWMDYSSDVCQTQFTAGQSTRMNATLVSGGGRYSLTQSDGCNPVYTNEANVFAIIEPSTAVCGTEIDPTIRIKNTGSNTLTSLRLTYKLDAGADQVYDWTGSLASGATVDITLPTITGLTVASHTFEVTSSLPNGLADPYTSNDYKSVTFSVAGSAPAAACMPTTTNLGNYGTGITRVRFGTLIDHTHNVGNNQELQDFTCSVYATYDPGTAQTLTINMKSAEYCKVFIDYNDNGVFTDAGELVLNTNGTATPTATVNIPSLPPVTGKLIRMRVIYDFNVIGNGCTNVSYGEIEDYGIFINHPPCAAPTINSQPLSAAGCDGSNAVMTFNLTGPSLSYQWQISTDGGSTFANVTNGGVYSGATTSTLTMTGLTTTYNGYKFRCVATNTCSTTTSDETTLAVLSAPTAAACSPTTTNTGNWGTGIARVRFNTIDKAHNDGINDGTQNFVCTDLTSVNAGSTYAFTINGVGGNAENCKIYVDYNNDGDFLDAGEQVFSSTASNTTHTGNITIPSTGVTTDVLLRMRVVTDFNNIANACQGGITANQLSYGEAEDYGVRILPPCPTITTQPSNSSVCAGTNTSFTVTHNYGSTFQWQEDSGSGFSNITNGGVYSNATTATLNLTSVTTGMSTYTYRCIISNSCGSITSSVVTLTVSSSVTPSVSIASSDADNTICAGTSVTFSATPTNGGTTPAYQWKLNGANVGTNSTTYTTTTLTNGDEVTCVLTSNATCAVPTSATSAGITTTVNPNVTPSVSIASSDADNTICAGTSVTFTATPTNGGATPTYQWRLNGANVGTNSTTYTTTTLTNGDEITCVLTSNATCVSPTSATSTGITTTVNTNLTPSVSIASSDADNTICAGESVTFTATPTNGGTTPAYQWKLNGANVGTNSATYITTALANGDEVTCVLTSNETCLTTASATSTGITTIVNPSVTPSVSIASSDADNTICAGTSVTFTATPTNGGTTPAYQWKLNGANVGTNSTTYTTTTLTNGDEVTCVLTSNATCAVPTSATSAGITTTVNPNVTPSVSIASSDADNTICAGTSVTFTATPTNGGATPTYQWRLNGANVGTNSTTYTTTTLTNGDEITCVLTSNATCVSPTSATSTGITTTVNTNLTPSVSIASSDADNTICAGESVTFTATPTNGGTTPAYQWKLNGANVGTNSATYITTALANGDEVTCVLTSNETCLTTASATSTGITTTVNPSVTPSVSITSSDADNTICAGTSVTFTATPTNGGTTPTYQWRLNGLDVGINSTTYTTTTLTNGDEVTCVLTSNATCAVPTSATSVGITTIVNPNVTPSVSIASSDADNTICAGTSVTFTATPTNGGATPTYQWKLNGLDVGTSSTTYTTTTLTNGDEVTCVLTSNATCVSPTSATSTGITTTVNTNLTPSVSIASSDADNTICAGESVTFTATPTNGGTTPAYQWKLNGANVGTNSATYITTALANGDEVTCVLTSNETCLTTASTTSTGITTIVNPSVTPSVSIASSDADNTICAGTSVTFSATPTNGGTTPAYQWKLNGANVGTNSTTYTTTTLTNGDEVTCVLTSNATCAVPTSATSVGITTTVNPNVTPSVSIASSDADNTICAGTSVTFTATPTNGGATPTYQWRLNGANVGTNSTTYTTTTLTNGDEITCVLTSNATCVSPTSATSTGITTTVNTNLTPSVSIASSDADNTICAGESVTFTATPTNGGTTPAYQWKLNGANVGTNSATYITTALANGDEVTCVLTSNETCLTTASATSTGITTTVNPSVTPSVSIASSDADNTICAGTSVTFTATPTNGGTTPAYQWKLNGANVGTNSTTYTTTTLTNGDEVTCVLTSNATCAVPTSATSAGITTIVNPNVTPSVSIASSDADNTICAGTSVTFTATPTNGGATPTYQWRLNGANVGTNSTTYTTTTLTNGDEITCVLTSNATCVSPTSATSTGITTTVNTNLTPSVSIASSDADNTICAGESVTFTATPTNGGTTPAYQWKLNGANVGTNSATYITTALANGDEVTCVLTSNETCLTTASATSTGITTTVNPSVTPSVSITSSDADNTICAGTSVTFTATPTNGGTTPTYQWRLNGLDVGINSTTYTTTTLTNGDEVTCVLTSNATCAVPTSATSVGITTIVNPNVTPSVSIASSDADNTICAGTSVTFTATPTNGGATPTYQWKLNGLDVGTSSTTYTTTTLTNGDEITCVLTSNATCATTNSANSNSITTVVSSPTIAQGTTSNPTACLATDGTIEITGSGTGTISWTGSSSGSVAATLPTTISNFTSGTYNFTFNTGCTSNTISISLSDPGSPATPTVSASGALDFCSGNNVILTSSSMTGNSWSTGETSQSISVTTTGNYTVSVTESGCTSPSSSPVNVNVTTSVTPSISISSSDADNTICAGESVTFTATATNGGTTPAYQWKLNGANVGTNTTTYTNTALIDGDIISCELTSNAVCASPTIVTSTSITVTVNTNISPTISIVSNDADNTICAGTSVTFTATSSNAGSTPTYQWKLNGANVGTNSTTYTSSTLIDGDVVSCELTSSAVCATSTFITSSGISMTVNPNLTPSVSITSSDANNTICVGEGVTFTATPTNGGTTPAYQWRLNGANVGTNSDTYSNASLTNGDIVTCVLTSNATCVSPTSATSTGITTTVNTNLTPSVSIASSDADNTICAGESVTFTATPTNGGTTPAYQWKLNGANVGTNSATYITTALANGDEVTCVLTSNETCLTTASTTSTGITTIVNPSVTPSVSIASSDADNIICVGEIVTFTATPTNGGTTPAYQWKLNGANVGTNSTSYTNSALVDGDVIFCELTSNAACVSSTVVISSTISMSVNDVNITQGTITNPSACLTSDGIIEILGTASGDLSWTGTISGSLNSVTLPITINSLGSGIYNFTLTNTCTSNTLSVSLSDPGAPTAPSITASGATSFCNGGSVVLSSSALSGNNWSTGETTQSITVTASGSYTVSVTDGGCTSPASSPTTVTVNSTVTPSLSIASSDADNTICAGESVTFTATPTNGGTTPTYQWKLNGIDVGTNSTTYTTTTLANGDEITCVLTSNATCVSPTTVTSTGITTIVNTNLTPSVSIASSDADNTICAGESVTFTATPTNGGTTPAYQWRVNGANVGTNSATYTTTTLINGDEVTCVLTSNETCLTTASATSTGITTTVNPSVTPSVSIASSDADNTICAGESVTFTATPTNGGSTPAFQWRLNGTNVGTNSPIYTNASLSDGDLISCLLTSNANCLTVSNALSNDVIISVNAIPTIGQGVLNNPTACGATDGEVEITGLGSGNITWSGTTSGSMNGITLPQLISGLGAGTYDFTFNDGCESNTISVNLSDPGAPSAPTITAGGSTTFCAGESVILTSSSALGNTWSTGETSQSITVTTAGTYTVTQTTAGCTSGASNAITVTVNTLPAIAQGFVNNPTACGATDGAVEITGFGTGDITWSGTTSGSMNGVTLPQLITGLGAGIYDFTFNDGCESNTINVSLSDPGAPATPTITASGATTFCAGGSVTLTSSSLVDNVWSTGETTQSITVNSTATYNVFVNTAGCISGTSSQNVTVNALPVIAQGVLNNPTACGATDGEVEITGLGSGNITWSGTASGSMNGVTLPQLISGLGAGTYDFTFNDGCESNTISVSLSDPGAPSAPTITAGGSTTFCAGESVILTSSSALGNTWSTGETSQSITVTTAGTYTVTQTTAGCTSGASNAITVTVNTLPAIAQGFVNNPTACGATDGEVEITGLGSGDITWSGTTSGNINGVTLPQLITGLGAGIYDFTFNDGCESNTINVSLSDPGAPATPTITASGATTFCAGGSVTLTSSSLVDNVWSTGETTQSITVNSTATYNVFVNTAGCISGTSSQNVTVNALPVIAQGVLNNPTACGATDGEVEITGLGSGNITWSGTTSGSMNGITLPQLISGLGAGTYDFTFNDGCESNTISVNLSDPGAPSAPTITAGGSTTFCAGESVILTSSSALGNTWSTGETSQSITVTTAGTYTVTQTTAGCTSGASNAITVTVNTLPAIAQGFVNNPTACGATDGEVEITGFGTGDITWSGTTSGNINGVTLPQLITGLGAGIYDFTFNDGCESNTISVSLSDPGAPATPTITASGATTFCAGGSVTLTSSSLVDNVWSTGETTQSITVNSTATYNVFVNTAGCISGTSSQNVTVNALPVIAQGVLNNPTACGATDGEVEITGLGSGNITWSGTASGSMNGVTLPQLISGLGAGTYAFTFNDGCESNTISVSLSDPNAEIPIISSNNGNVICEGENLILTSSYADGNIWSTGETTQSIVVSIADDYSVTFLNNSCSATSTNFSLTVNPKPSEPTISLIGQNSICEGDFVELISSSPTGNIWSTGDTTQSIFVSQDGTYSVTVSENNCSTISSETSIIVNQIPQTPVINNLGSLMICEGETLTLSSSSSNGNIWSTGENTQNINISSPGTYTLQVEEFGCLSETSSITVTLNPFSSQSLLIFVEGSTTFCEGGSVLLTASFPSNILWSTGETSQTITVNSSQTVTVSSTQSGCTIVSDEVNITENLNPVVNIQSYDDICNTATPFSYFNGVPSGGFYYLNGDSSTLFNPSLANLGSNNLDYTFIDENGCIGSSSTTINVYDCVDLNEEDKESFVIYPNPTNGYLIVKGNLNNNLQSIEIRDELGRIVLVQTDVFIETTLNLSDLADGMYSLILKGNNFEKIERIQLIK
jgi:hypothetical protein